MITFRIFCWIFDLTKHVSDACGICIMNLQLHSSLGLRSSAAADIIIAQVIIEKGTLQKTSNTSASM